MILVFQDTTNLLERKYKVLLQLSQHLRTWKEVWRFTVHTTLDTAAAATTTVTGMIVVIAIVMCAMSMLLMLMLLLLVVIQTKVLMIPPHL